ncbi:MAG TPA: serine hydrolase domain-containing protein [Bryobacteraceae bacterium]|nr:serine hydrolase domain-containing protein [Bryobacteraceae bacterium]
MTRRSLLSGGLALALRREKFDQAVGLIQRQVDSGVVAAAVLRVQSGGETFAKAFGAAPSPKAVFLLASITKPMTASAVMVLADRKELSIADPVQKYIPEFRGGERDRVTIRHLLTHTSGLPDMLPQNEELRKRHAPLKSFVAGACSTPLLFSPGKKVSYQSMGILLAAEIVERITRRRLPDFLQDQIFRPLGMRDTSLGLGGRPLAATMQSQVDDPTNWDWNSPYWRNLAAPWGGALAPAGDVSRLLHYFAAPDRPVLQPATVHAMISNQTPGMNPPWGLGWKVEKGFGKECSSRTFGHYGSTGTLAWLDPEKSLSFVLLTTKPAAVSEKLLLDPVSDIVSEARR